MPGAKRRLGVELKFYMNQDLALNLFRPHMVDVIHWQDRGEEEL